MPYNGYLSGYIISSLRYYTLNKSFLILRRQRLTTIKCFINFINVFIGFIFIAVIVGLN